MVTEEASSSVNTVDHMAWDPSETEYRGGQVGRGVPIECVTCNHVIHSPIAQIGCILC